MRALLPGAALRRSMALFRARPIATLALGLALLTSLLAVCCGLGVFTAPWLLCELFALQIALGSGQRIRRGSSWFAAALVQMVAVSVLGAVAGLTLLALGPDVAFGGIALGVPSRADQVAKAFGVLIPVGGLALALSVHFEHAPAILIDRGGSLHAAVLESSRLVAASGTFRTWLTSVVAHGLQLLPGFVAVALAAGYASLPNTLLWGLALLPVVALGIALGQGMVVASYLNLRDQVTDPAAVSHDVTSKSGAFVWNVLLLSVLLGPLLVSAALTKPACPEEAPMPADLPTLLVVEAGSDERALYIPDSALTLRVSQEAVALVASDGGGAGRLPLPGPVARLRVARPRQLPLAFAGLNYASSTYVIETDLRDGRRFTTWVDGAGVRLDDSLTRRLSALLPSWAPLLLGLCLVWTAVWIAWALPPLAQLRKQLAGEGSASTEADRRDQLKTALRRRALSSALWLGPAALCSLWLGLWAALK